MTDTKKAIIPISTIFIGLGVIATVLNHKRYIKVDKKVDSAKEDIKSVLRYQEERNKQMNSELEGLRDEVGCCYEHFENHTKDEDNGR